MKYPHSIPLWYTNGEPVPGGNRGRVVLSSTSTKWNDIVLEQRHVPSTERADVMYKRHVIAINIGHSFTWEFEKDGRFHRVQMARGTISFCPSHQPFSHVTLRRSKHPELTSDFLRVPKITDINMSLSIRPLLKKSLANVPYVTPNENSGFGIRTWVIGSVRTANHFWKQQNSRCWLQNAVALPKPSFSGKLIENYRGRLRDRRAQPK
jgi:hypothetical protein